MRRARQVQRQACKKAVRSRTGNANSSNGTRRPVRERNLSTHLRHCCHSCGESLAVALRRSRGDTRHWRVKEDRRDQKCVCCGCGGGVKYGLRCWTLQWGYEEVAPVTRGGARDAASHRYRSRFGSADREELSKRAAAAVTLLGWRLVRRKCKIRRQCDINLPSYFTLFFLQVCLFLS